MLTKVHSDTQFDYYCSPAFGDEAALYNIVPVGSPPPSGGYYRIEEIEKRKGTLFPERYHRPRYEPKGPCMLHYEVKASSGAVLRFKAHTEQGAKRKASEWQTAGLSIVLYCDIDGHRNLEPIARKEAYNTKWQSIF